jgi:hypothetical protein
VASEAVERFLQSYGRLGLGYVRELQLLSQRATKPLDMI